VDIREGYGRVLASDVMARDDSPRKDSSHFDGFALISADTVSATPDSPIALLLRRGANALGISPKGTLRHRQAMKILTGGYLPAGADAVIPLEEITTRGGEIQVHRHVKQGERVYRAGADVRKGESILKAGRTLMGQDLVLLASLHFERVLAFKRPRVAILPTGTELTTNIGERRSGKVVESHSLLFTRLIEEAGGEAVTLPIVPD
jgi:molybdopterin biosynthesis enzyme